MLRTRIIPALLVKDACLVKTTRFSSFDYVGDPCNTVRIFNELEVDELLVLDISGDRVKRGPDLSLITEIAAECFMPLAYGGGVRTLEDAHQIFASGVEKVVVNSAALERPTLIRDIANVYGSQAVIISIDVKRGLFGGNKVFVDNARRRTGLNPVTWAQTVVEYGAGEILLTSVDLEGTWSGFDLELVRSVSDAVPVPVIAHGGAGSIQHIQQVVNQSNATAVALGSMVVFQKKGMGVLVNFPDKKDLESVLT